MPDNITDLAASIIVTIVPIFFLPAAIILNRALFKIVRDAPNDRVSWRWFAATPATLLVTFGFQLEWQLLLTVNAGGMKHGASGIWIEVFVLLLACVYSIVIAAGRGLPIT